MDTASSLSPLASSTSISSISSIFTSEKLFTKFSGFCISWATPAVSSPNEAIFSDCINCFWPSISCSFSSAASISSFWSCNNRLARFRCLLLRQKTNTNNSKTINPGNKQAYMRSLFRAGRQGFGSLNITLPLFLVKI